MLQRDHVRMTRVNRGREVAIMKLTLYNCCTYVRNEQVFSGSSPTQLLLSLACHLCGHQGPPYTGVKEAEQLIQRFLDSAKDDKTTHMYAQCREHTGVELY